MTAPDSADRRHQSGLTFDRDAGVLRMGTHERRLAPGDGNREVLVAYVELTARTRGDRVANVVEVRQADVEALAAALDLDAADLGRQVEQVLGTTRAEAQQVVARLRESRLIGGIAKAATSAAVAGLLVTGCAGGSSSAPARPTTSTTTTTSSSTTTTDDGDVGLIPPASVVRPDPGDQ